MELCFQIKIIYPQYFCIKLKCIRKNSIKNKDRLGGLQKKTSPYSMPNLKINKKSSECLEPLLSLKFQNEMCHVSECC